MMNHPELFQKSNTLTREAAIQCLNEYRTKIKWKKSGDSAIDLGSADGSVSCLIKKYFPGDDVKFFGCDISEKMVEFAKKHHAVENITFRVLDAAGELPQDLKGGFNHVFSFFTLNCIQNQEKTFENIFDLLNEDGDCLLAFIQSVPIYRMLNHAAQDPKWSSTWLKTLKEFISPYFYMEKPEQKVAQIMTDIGFIDIDVQCKNMTSYLENGLVLKNLMKSVQSFTMTDDAFEELAKDCVSVAQDLGLLDKGADSFEAHEGRVEFNYTLLVAYASKPKYVGV